MILGRFLAGFFARIITGLDDVAAHAPIACSITWTRKGRIAFVIGMAFALAVLLVLASTFAMLLEKISFWHEIAAALLVLLAAAIYFDVFRFHSAHAEEELAKKKTISHERFAKLAAIGFVAFIATAVDDFVVYTTLLHGALLERAMVIAGIVAAAIIEFALIFSCARMIAGIPYKKQITAAGLLLFAVAVYLRLL